jgi:hypothetical protein
MSRNYKSGSRIEYIIRDFYRAADCEVIRSAGSQGAADLVVFKPDGGVMLIQCKKTAEGGTAQFKDDVRRLMSFRVGGKHMTHITRWLYVLRTRAGVVDTFLVSDDGAACTMRLDWGSILKVVKGYRDG